MTDTRSTIRSMWAQLGLQTRPAEVVEALERLGIEVSEEFVARVRSHRGFKPLQTLHSNSTWTPNTRPDPGEVFQLHLDTEHKA